MTTSEVAAKAGVNLDTVRFYEKRGLVPEPPRTASGYRQYGSEHVSHIRFVRRAQRLGFTLDEIGELLGLRATRQSATDVRRRTLEKIAEIEDRIRDLTRIRDKLAELTDLCERQGHAEGCRVLNALDTGDNEL